MPWHDLACWQATWAAVALAYFFARARAAWRVKIYTSVNANALNIMALKLVDKT